MNALPPMQGRCMCGAVRFTATPSETSVMTCHCEMCQRWCSGPFMALNCSEVNFEDKDVIGIIQSSDWAERGFCTRCGSNLYYRIRELESYQMAAGLFDDPSNLRLSLQVFIDQKPHYYDFANETRSMTSQEVIAAFSQSSD